MLIGHEKQQKVLRDSIKEGSLAHAYLFSGPSGIGKLEIATDAAQNLLNCSLQDASDGYFYKNAFNIEEARKLKKDLALSPMNSNYKVVVINNAQNIKKEAASAILKLLEEPSADTIFFIVTTNSFLLLPTIRSRCYEIKFNYISDRLIEKYLNTKGIIEFKEHWSGRPAIAKKLLENKEYLNNLIKYKKAVSEFMNGSLAESFQIIDKYSKAGDIGYFLKVAIEQVVAISFKNKYVVLRQLLELYKGLFATNLNSQFGLRAIAVKSRNQTRYAC